MTRWKIKSLCLALGVLSLAPLAQAQVSRPADALSQQLFGKSVGNSAGQSGAVCFRRAYDPAHLAGHPQQNVTSMLLLVSRGVENADGYAVKMGVRFRGRRAQFESGGYCTGGSGLSCGVECDGGSIDVAIRDGNSVLVKIPDGARLWRPGDKEDDMNSRKKFGPDDKTFRLDRTRLTDCLPIVHEAGERAKLRNLR